MLKQRRAIVAAVGAVVLLGAAASGRAWGNPSHATVLTFSGPVALPGVTLGTGAYLFEVMNPTSGGNVVVVRSADRKRVCYLGFTHSMEKPANARGPIALGEARRGDAPPVLAWYPDDSSIGHQFIYR
jgi:hypothetical protein